MKGPSVTPDDRTVFAVCAPCSWCPPSSLPVAPHFSYQAPTSANHAPYSGLWGLGSAGVSRISITYFTRVSFCPRGAHRRAPSHRTPRTAPRQFRHTVALISAGRDEEPLVPWGQDAKLVALGVGEHHPGHVALADVDAAGAE